MRKFPYFFSDAVLISMAVLSLLLAIIYSQIIWYCIFFFLLDSWLIFLRYTDKQPKDFENSIKRIKGLTGMDTDFFSIGNIFLYYRGEKVSYKSVIRNSGKTIPVDYFLEFENGNNANFTITRNLSGGYSSQGNDSVLKEAKSELARFDECYKLLSVANSKGKLKLCVSLEFEPAPPPSKDEKLIDMSNFMDDYLAFGHMLNLLLKKKTSKKQDN